jgi:thioredoxin 1
VIKTNQITKIVLSLLLIGMVSMSCAKEATVNTSRQKTKSKAVTSKVTLSSTSTLATNANSTTAQKPLALPKLVDLGAKSCIPCKMMAPILEDLKKEYKGKLEVVFIDVWENPKAGEEYGIKMIPTQIFYDAQGKELFRHSGYFPKEDILKTFKDKGISLSK